MFRRFNPGTRQNRFTYPHLCQVLDRFPISDIAGCAIANAVLQDLELLEPENVLTRDKVRSQRNYWRKKEVKIQSVRHTNLFCIGFDGRKDETLFITNVEN